jgi:hypothetical protein
VTQWGKLTGLDLDRLTFDSAPGGAAEPPLSNGNLRPVAGTLAGGGSAALPTPAVKVVSSSATGARLSVTGASGPFWLVLGESVNAGWKAGIVGGPSLGGSTLIDGFANGWYVDPHSGSFVVDLSWTPQREVDIALVASALAILACLLLAFVPWGRLSIRRRRPSPGWPSRRRHAVGASPAAGATGAGSHADPKDPFDGGWPATLGPAWLADGGPAGPLASLVVAVAVGALGVLLLPPAWALPFGGVLALATLIAARFGGTRFLLTFGAVAAAVVAAAATVTGQMTYHYAPGDHWPESFSGTNIAALVAFVAIAADSLVELVRQRAAARAGPSTGEEAESDP